MPKSFDFGFWFFFCCLKTILQVFLGKFFFCFKFSLDINHFVFGFLVILMCRWSHKENEICHRIKTQKLLFLFYCALTIKVISFCVHEDLLSWKVPFFNFFVQNELCSSLLKKLCSYSNKNFFRILLLQCQSQKMLISFQQGCLEKLF